MSYPIFIGRKEGELLFLDKEEAHHAYVKRIKQGYLIKVNDLNGHIYLGKVLELSKKSLKAQFLEEIPVKESDLKINFYLCIPNHLSKIDELIPFITELGVYRFTPVLCENTAIKEKDVLKKIERWEKISINSIKQCERLFPVIIQNPVKIKEIVADADFNALFYEREKDNFLKNYCNLKIKTANIIVGNEGGFTQEEVKLLKEKGFQTLSLSENILRMETAVITAVCQINFCFRN